MSIRHRVELSFATQHWLSGTSFEPVVNTLASDLVGRGYAIGTVRSYMSCIAHFTHWCVLVRLNIERVDEDASARFLNGHLQSCHCASRCSRGRVMVRAALAHLIKALRVQGIIGGRGSSIPSGIAVQLHDFGTYLTEVRGLQATTRDTRVQHIHGFLLDRFDSADIEIGALEPADITRFILDHTRGWKPASIRTVGSSLRSYFRYKAVLGEDTTALSAAVPCVAQWRLSGLPKGLSSTEVGTLLGAFDRNTAGGRRDYAIARCYVDLGLRTSEVVRLQLDDFDWREGVVHVRSKGRRTDGLPLPEATGKAIAAYLCDGRGRTASRAVFLRLHPPFDKPAGPDTIRGAVRNAAQRCGLSNRLTGPHALRHTLAIELVRSGASLKEIADLLRHRSLDTTTIYAKVDLEALSTVAAPWPGSRT